ncbi:MAG: hypothetical protein U5L96_19170 [Owenweeksia sp.]|nr:hypothetical protein [Owenweeksia sp.]
MAKIEQTGTMAWFNLDTVPGNDISSDIIYDSQAAEVYVCGTSDRNGSYDLLLTAYESSGAQQWITTRDYQALADVGAVINKDGSYLMINGSSQSSQAQWDIVSWRYTMAGVFVGEQRNTGLNAASDELKDGALNNGYIHLTGTSTQGTHNDFKVVCLDANNNFLWQHSYDKNGLEDQGNALVPITNGFVATGFVTPTAANENILIHKYDLNGNVLWNAEIDENGGNDRGIDIIEDPEGNYLVLADVEINDQTDVYLYYFEGT